MIKTKTYRLSNNHYTKIVLISRLKKAWWLYALMIIVAILHLKKFSVDSFSAFAVIFGFAYPIISTVYLYFWSLSNNGLAEPINMSFDNSTIYFESDGTKSQIPISNIKKVVNFKDLWLLYLSKGQFINVNKDIFYTQEDFESFSKLINVPT